MRFPCRSLAPGRDPGQVGATGWFHGWNKVPSTPQHPTILQLWVSFRALAVQSREETPRSCSHRIHPPIPWIWINRLLKLHLGMNFPPALPPLTGDRLLLRSGLYWLCPNGEWSSWNCSSGAFCAFCSSSRPPAEQGTRAQSQVITGLRSLISNKNLGIGVWWPWPG